MRILTVGGGSGGHVTPVVAVVSELQKIEPGVEIRFWCDKPFESQAKATMLDHDSDMVIQTIISGKFRRYHSMGLIRQLVQIRTIVLPNIIDSIKIMVGTLQSIYKLARWRPDVIFTKGGFVCLPVGFASWLLQIPLVIHDSDAHPGLTNRILSRVATRIATGAPLEYYPYPKNRSTYVGIPVRDGLKPYDVAQRKKMKHELGFSEAKPLIVITGGGLGATRLNNAVLAVIEDLLAFSSILLISGTSQYKAIHDATETFPSSFQVKAFISSGFHDVLGASDIVVSRAGATTLAELAALAKPTILVPNAYLTGGHQLKNAQVYERAGAAVVVDEDRLEAEPLSLVDTINALVLNAPEMKHLAKEIHAFAKPHAARDTAQLIIDAVKQ